MDRVEQVPGRGRSQCPEAAVHGEPAGGDRAGFLWWLQGCLLLPPHSEPGAVLQPHGPHPAPHRRPPRAGLAVPSTASLPCPSPCPGPDVPSPWRAVRRPSPPPPVPAALGAFRVLSSSGLGNGCPGKVTEMLRAATRLSCPPARSRLASSVPGEN